MEIITSRSNPRIKKARALRQRRQREIEGAFLVEGIHHVGAAIEAGAALEILYYAPDLLESSFGEKLVAEAASRGVLCQPVAAEVFRSLADKEHPQGVLAVVRRPEASLNEIGPEDFTWGVALVAPQDPGNVGAILRTIDAVGAAGLLLLDGGVDAYHPTAVRASMGAIFRLPVIEAAFADFVRWTGDRGYHIYGTSAHASLDYRRVAEYQRPLILLFGNEQVGLTSEQAAACEAVVTLPMRGRVTSLNLAVAAGVLLYDLFDRFDPDSHSIWK